MRTQHHSVLYLYSYLSYSSCQCLLPFFLPGPLNTTTSHTCTFQCGTQTGAGTCWMIQHTNTTLENVRCHPQYRHELFVLLIGRGWPINAPVRGPDHWLAARWRSVKCAINLGHGPQHIRVAEDWHRVPLTWVKSKAGFTGSGKLIQLNAASRYSLPSAGGQRILWERLCVQIMSTTACFCVKQYDKSNFTRWQTP